MREIRVVEPLVFVGAAVAHGEIVRDPLLNTHAQCLVEASGLIGGPQVRNAAAIGGNVAHGLPAGDGTIALLALDAEAQVAGPNGMRWHPLEDLFLAPGQTILAPRCELLTDFRFPLMRPSQGTAFHCIMRPHGLALAILNMSAWL